MQHKEVFDYWKNKLNDFELLGNIKSGMLYSVTHIKSGVFKHTKTYLTA